MNKIPEENGELNKNVRFKNQNDRNRSTFTSIAVEKFYAKSNKNQHWAEMRRNQKRMRFIHIKFSKYNKTDGIWIP